MHTAESAVQTFIYVPAKSFLCFVLVDSLSKLLTQVPYNTHYCSQSLYFVVLYVICEGVRQGIQWAIDPSRGIQNTKT